MLTSYISSRENRIRQVRDDNQYNGIEFLEVFDHPEGASELRQKILFVSCLKSTDSLMRENVRITAGRDAEPVNVVWATSGDRFIDENESLSMGDFERWAGGNWVFGENVLVVRTDSSGNFARYRLEITRSSTNPNPHEDFDTQLYSIEFSFKVACPADQDCRSARPPVVPVFKESSIDYLAKDYSSFRRLLMDRLSVITPKWKERNPSDIMVALVELLAYAGDYLSYYQDAVATEAYLSTARRRVSVLRHARLLDYYVHEGNNSRVWVCFEYRGGGSASDNSLKAETQLLTGSSAPPGVMEGEKVPVAVSEGAQVFETMYEITLRTAKNEMLFHTWGDDNASLREGATSATLKGNPSELGLEKGDVLVFEEVRGKSGFETDANPNHRHVVRLNSEPELNHDFITGKNTGEEVTEITWYPEDALPFSLCLWQVGEDNKPMSVARGNVVLADHGRTVVDELVPHKVPEKWRYRPNLIRNDITHRAYYDADNAKTQPTSYAIIQEKRDVLPCVVLENGDDDWFLERTRYGEQIEGEEWEPVRDLLSSDRFAKEFVVEMENDGRAFIRFGDNVLGRRPVSGGCFLAEYRVGCGKAGNVGAKAIVNVVPKNNAVSAVSKVYNPLPGEGGTEPETIDQVRFNAPQAFKVQERAVSVEDYPVIVQRRREVQKAIATTRWTGSWETIFLAVDRKGGLPVDDDFKAELIRFLEHYRMAGHDIEIEAPRFVPLDIAMTVHVKPNYLGTAVSSALKDSFGNTDLPRGERGFFHSDNFTFGQPVYLSEIVATAMKVPGVSWVDTDDTSPKQNRFKKWGEKPEKELEEAIIKTARLEIVRIDNDPNAPQNGNIEFFMEGGL